MRHLLLGLILAMPTVLPALDDARIMPYRHGKAAALSLTFDDGWAKEVEDAVTDLSAHGLRGTFFVMPLAMERNPKSHASWERLAELLAAGHEIGTHATVKPRLHECDAATLAAIVDGGHDRIGDRLGVDPVCFALPGGTKATDAVLAAVARKHAFLRRPDRFLPSGETMGARVMAYGDLGHRPWKGARELAAIERTIADGGWRIAVIHAIRGGGYAPFPEDDAFADLCAGIAALDQLWIAPMGEVARYRTAAARAELTLRPTGDRSCELTLTVPAEVLELCTVPLTVRIPVADAGSVSVSRGGEAVPCIAVAGGVQLELLPDGLAVTVAW